MAGNPPEPSNTLPDEEGQAPESVHRRYFRDGHLRQDGGRLSLSFSISIYISLVLLALSCLARTHFLHILLTIRRHLLIESIKLSIAYIPIIGVNRMYYNNIFMLLQLHITRQVLLTHCGIFNSWFIFALGYFKFANIYLSLFQ